MHACKYITCKEDKYITLESCVRAVCVYSQAHTYMQLVSVRTYMYAHVCTCTDMQECNYICLTRLCFLAAAPSRYLMPIRASMYTCAINIYIYIYIYTYIYIYIYGTPPSYKHGVKLKARARTWATRIPRACLTSFDRQVRAYSCCVPLLPRRQPEISYRP